MKKGEYKDSTSQMIIEAVNFASMASLNAADCGVHLSASLYLNIRDAMFHFKALYESDEDSEMSRHYYNLKEHIVRGEKDAIINYVQQLCDAIHNLMQKNDFKVSAP